MEPMNRKIIVGENDLIYFKRNGDELISLKQGVS